VHEQVEQTWMKMIDTSAASKLKELGNKLKTGQRLMETMSELAKRRSKTTDTEEAAEATRLMFAVFSAAHKKYERAEAMQAADPMGAYYKFKTLSEDLKGTQIADKAEKAAYALKGNDRVMREHEAELEVKKMIAIIVTFKGNPLQADFRAKNADGMRTLENECRRIYARYRDTVAGQHLLVIQQDFQFNLE